MDKKYNDLVAIANEYLEKQEPDSIQSYKTMSGFEATGYKPQFIFDAANLAFGTTGWKHVLKGISVDVMPLKEDKATTVATAEVVIQLLNEKGEVIFESGSQFGGSKVISGNVADGKKGAVTDAIGKALSIMGIGSKAYRGEVEKDITNSKASNELDLDSAPKSTNRFKAQSTGGFKAKTQPKSVIVNTTTTENVPVVEVKTDTPVQVTQTGSPSNTVTPSTTSTMSSNGNATPKPTFRTGKFAEMLAKSKGNA